MTDWNQAAQSFVDGILWGVGFAIPFFIGITWSILKILGHPSIRAIARAAANLSAKGGGGILGQIWDAITGKTNQ